MRTLLLSVAADTAATTVATAPVLGLQLRNELIIVATTVAINILKRVPGWVRAYRQKRRKRNVHAALRTR